MRVIGIDTGGTFTDTVVMTEGRGPVVGKAPSTPPEFEQGVIDSLGAAAEASGLGMRALLESTSVVAHGTTVALNALLTGTGAKVGLLVTEGFESTLPLARANKLFGLPPGEITNALRWRKPDLLVPRRRIIGVRERIDAAGRVVVPLDEAHARKAIASLRDQGVDAVGVCLLWSTVEPRHELRLLEWIDELVPAATVTLSSELAPRLGEYERTSSVVVNAYVAPLVGRYLDELGARLHQEGFRGRLMAVSMSGGVLPLETVVTRPIHTLHSGPAAGLDGARQLALRLAHENVIATDVGGTSFDVGLVVDGELPLSKQPMIERQALAVPLVEVNSIGTGGGSIAWLDESDSSVHVGPASAGSRPGPACYGRGGTLPTLTDAAVVLGYIDRLGGRLELDARAATTAVREHIARPLGIDVTTAASGIYEVAVAQMADLIRQSTIRRGHDPTRFWLYAYGGAAPQYAGRYAADLGTPGVVIPNLAPEFSAQGAATSDSRMRLEWEVAPCPVGEALPWMSGRFEDLASRAAEQLGAERSATAGSLQIERRVALRFHRQLNAIEIDVGDEEITTSRLDTLVELFRSRYEQLAGPAPARTPVELVALVLIASRPRPTPTGSAARSASASAEPARSRRAFFDGGFRDCPVFDWDRLAERVAVAGPAFVESGRTTAVIFPGQIARLDAARHLHLVLADVA